MNIAVTILLSPNINDKLFNYSDQLLKFFVKHFEEIYGTKYNSHNIHGLIHISSDYTRFGPLDLCSCFPFENQMKFLKKSVRKHHKPLEQIVRRYEGQQKNEFFKSKNDQHIEIIVLNYEHSNGPLIGGTCGPQYLKMSYLKKIQINIRTVSDIYVLMNTGEIVKIINVAHCYLTKEVVVIGYHFKNKASFYNKPIKSTKLDIYIVNNLSNNLLFWKVTNIKKKLMLFSFKNQSITFPILHTEC